MTENKIALPPPGNRDGKEGDAAKASEDNTHDLAQGWNPPGGGNQLLGDFLLLFLGFAVWLLVVWHIIAIGIGLLK